MTRTSHPERTMFDYCLLCGYLLTCMYFHAFNLLAFHRSVGHYLLYFSGRLDTEPHAA